tara:strand:- start:1469 stop:2074 length:606 start_codon:yes stop_codon:yes gene_type:complete
MDFNVKTSKIINFFSLLEKKEIVSQSNLAKDVLISLGMANAILKKAISKGFVKAKAAPYKRYIYYLTKDGFNEKSRLVREYLDSSLNFFKKAKEMYLKILIDVKKKKLSVVLVGEGDLVDICKLSLIHENLNVLDHLKLDSNKKLTPQSKKIKNNLKNIAFIIVESKKPQFVYEELNRIFDEINVFYPKFLHISKKNGKQL